MCKKYFPLMPHGKLRKLTSNVYEVTGSMKLFGIFRYSRNMTIIKHDHQVIIVNPVRVDEQTLENILKLGTISHILKIGGLHSVDIAFYKDRFNAKIWGLKNDDYFKNNKADYYFEDFHKLPMLGITPYIIENSRIPEALLFIPLESGIIVSCDFLVNMGGHDPFANMLVRTLSKFLKNPTYIGPNWIKIARPPKESINPVLEFGFDKLITAHGPALLKNAKSLIQPQIEEYMQRN